MHFKRVFALCALGLVQAAAAQDIAAPAPPVSEAAAPAPCCAIPALTPVDLEILATINSQANKIGEKFAFKLASPIVVDGKTLVPAGAMGSGDIVHAAKSRFSGKPGELVLAARYLDHNGVRIPLRSLRAGGGQGKDNTDASIAVAAAVSGVLAMFITGGEVNIPAGTIMNAKVSAATPVADPIATTSSTTTKEGSTIP